MSEFGDGNPKQIILDFLGIAQVEAKLTDLELVQNTLQVLAYLSKFLPTDKIVLLEDQNKSMRKKVINHYGLEGMDGN